jgi:uncharacterized membrane protein YphA (DoxX/SURF4 family)
MGEDKEAAINEAAGVRHWRWWVTRLLAGAIGAILLTAGVLKAMDMELFIRQIRDYGILSNRAALVLTAWGLITVECVLGVGLLVFYRPRLILLFTGLLLLVFIGATGRAWATGATQDCGCFGAWAKRTPGEAMMEDIIMLVAVSLVWVGHRRKQLSQTRIKFWATTAAGLIGLALPVLFGFPISAISQSQSKPSGFDLGYVQVQGLDNVDLSHGEYLVVLMDTECSHCQEGVPKFNALAAAKDLPRMVALCKNEEWQRLVFVDAYHPTFSIGQISEQDFMRLLAAGDTPRTMLVRDQHALKVWDQAVPTKDAVKAARGK